MAINKKFVVKNGLVAPNAEITGVLTADSIISGNTTLDTLVDTAYSNAVSYANDLANTTYANAVSYTDTAVANLIDTAPEALNTLNELSAALNDDPDFANTIVGQITTAYTNATSYTDAEITALGLGSISTQNSNSVNISGGSISGITDLAVADGGTGASDASGARTNLGLGSIATQNSNSVNIDGGTIDGTAVNATTLTASGDVNFDSGTLFVDASENRVGIGTTSPTVEFEVLGAGNTVQFRRAGAGTILFGLDGSTNEIFSRDGGTGHFPLAIFTGSSERMRIDSSGNVGIGTTSPGARLDIQKGTSGGIVTLGGLSTDQLSMGADGTGHYQEWNSNTGAKSVIRLQTRNSGAGNYTSILVDGGNQNFRVNTNGTERMRITSTGNVLPGANATQDLGSDTLRWNTVYTSDLSLKNDHGDWTVVEGEDDLFLYNNKKGKVYKFALTEVDPDIVPPKRD